MRPIDADRLHNEILSMNIIVGGKSIFHPAVRESVLAAIEMSETLDCAPEKRGEWIPLYKEDKNPKTGFPRGRIQFGWFCSACRHGRSGFRRNFCPNCGARMDGKEETTT